MPQSSITAWLQRATASPSIVVPQRSLSDLPLQPPDSVPGEDDPHKVSHTTSPALVTSVQRRCPTIPINAHITSCEHDRIASFHRLNALLLPISYPQSFYDETLQDPTIASLTRIVIWEQTKSRKESTLIRRGASQTDTAPEGQIVAGVRCRLLPASLNRSDEETVLYISTIGVLAPFRRHSLASALLEEVVRVARENYRARSVMAHVWERNEDAIEWYTRRGFEVVKKEAGYYRRLAPHTGAFLMRRKITASDILTCSKPTTDT